MFRDGFSGAKLAMGITPSVWDRTPATAGNGHLDEVDSATSIAHVGGQDWLVAFQHGDQARVFEFDSSRTVRDFGSDATPVTGVTNDNLVDRPAIVNRNGLLVASWLLTNKGCRW